MKVVVVFFLFLFFGVVVGNVVSGEGDGKGSSRKEMLGARWGNAHCLGGF